MNRRVFMPFLLLLALLLPAQAQAGKSSGWLPWSKDIFERAKAEKRFVLLDLEAVWCHWCHVMDEKTYSDPEVKKLIKDKYIPVRVDQDTNLELSNRYGDWGWPATIIFAPDGTEIVKLRGYIPPVRMISILKAIIEDPSPGPSVIAEVEVQAAKTTFLSEAQKKHLIGNYTGVYDNKNGGWGSIHKFIHTDSMDYAIAKAITGDKEAEKKARQTLDAALHLIDPVWGGVYQYSDQTDWKSPHYEKIMWFQAQYLRHYSQAYAIWKKLEYLKAAKNIHKYLTTILRNENGAFYTSQDADLSKEIDGKKFYALDDKERRKLGTPKIDKNLYARENGWAISGLVAFYNITADAEVLKQALQAMEWVNKNRRLEAGGYKRGTSDKSGPYLGDTLAMAQASLDLYTATGQRKWLINAEQAAKYIGNTFKHKSSGFITSASTSVNIGVFAKPVRQFEENIQLARFMNLLNRYHGSKEFKEYAEHTMRYLVSDQITAMRRFLIGVVLADQELAIEPAHITIVGNKDDTGAIALHKKARTLPYTYKRVDWWDKREGPMINPDVEYPQLEKAAAFACANNICSLPVFKAENLKPQVDRMLSNRIAKKN